MLHCLHMRKSSLVRLAVLAFLAGGVWVAYTQGPQPSKLTTQKIGDNLYVIHNDFVPGNTTALVTTEGVILVDDKFPVDADNIVAEVKKITPQPIKFVVNTHYHMDHSGGNARMQALGAQVITSEQTHRYMVEAKQPGLSNVTFQGGRGHIYLGGQHVELFYFGRSHTGGDTVAYFPAQRVVAMGDMFTFGDATPELIDYAGGGSAKDWTNTVGGAIALDFDVVVPGHGVVTNKAELIKFQKSTMTLRTAVHDMVATKKSRAEVEAMLRKDFHFADLHVNASLDGMMAELR